MLDSWNMIWLDPPCDYTHNTAQIPSSVTLTAGLTMTYQHIFFVVWPGAVCARIEPYISGDSVYWEKSLSSRFDTKSTRRFRTKVNLGLVFNLTHFEILVFCLKFKLPLLSLVSESWDQCVVKKWAPINPCATGRCMHTADGKT